MLAAVTVFLILSFALLTFLYNKNLYHSIRNGDVGPIFYLAKPSLRFISNLYCFRYKYTEGSWVAYVEKMPASLALHSSYKTPYLYFVKPIQSFDEIRRKSFSWADKMQSNLKSDGRKV